MKEGSHNKEAWKLVSTMNNYNKNEVSSSEIGREQSRLALGRSFVDNLFVLQQPVKKQIAIAQEVHLAFIDLRKAYATVPLSKLQEALEPMKMNETYN